MIYSDRSAQTFTLNDTVIPPASTETIRLFNLNDKPNSIIVVFNVEGVVYGSPQGAITASVTSTAAQNQTGNRWHFRVRLNVFSSQNRVKWPVAVHLDFTQILTSIGVSGTFDVNSIRVTDYQGRILLHNFTMDPWYDPVSSASGWLVFEANQLNTGDNLFYIYFDILENNNKPKPQTYYHIGVFQWNGQALYDDYYIVLATDLEGFIPYIQGGRLLLYGDDSSLPYNFPFTFNLYNRPVQTLYVTTNGIIWEDEEAEPRNTISTFINVLGIYGFWDDLYAPQSGNYGVYHAGTFTNRLVMMDTIWWHTLYVLKFRRFITILPLEANFTVTLSETGDIIVQYGTIEYTVGTYHLGVSAGDGTNYLYISDTDYTWLNGKTLIYLFRPNLSATVAEVETGEWSLG